MLQRCACTSAAAFLQMYRKHLYGPPAIFHTECGEAGEPAAHERVQDERAGLRRPAEDRGEGAERRPPACSPLSLQGQNRGQRHAGHPGERGCKEPNRLLLTSVSGLVTCLLYNLMLPQILCADISL